MKRPAAMTNPNVQRSDEFGDPLRRGRDVPMAPAEDGLFTLEQVAVLADRRCCVARQSGWEHSDNQDGNSAIAARG
jgi:hypothetical protein